VRVRSERYDIEATAGSGAFPPPMTDEARREPMKLMLRTLLADRFHLEVRRSEKEMPVCTLTVAKGGPKLTPAKSPGSRLPGRPAQSAVP